MSNDDPKPLSIAEAMETLSKACGLPRDFLNRLFLEDDDWSFVIKTSALLESITCTLIAAHLDRPALENLLAKEIEMSKRLRLLSALNLLSKNERKMMHALANLRNRLVHNADQTRFTFVEHFKNPEHRKNFIESFGLSWPDPLPNAGGSPIPRAEYVLTMPKYAIWGEAVGIAVAMVSEVRESHDRMIVAKFKESAERVQQEQTPDSD